jgi:L,D-transpeptidase catalytic domain
VKASAATRVVLVVACVAVAGCSDSGEREVEEPVSPPPAKALAIPEPVPLDPERAGETTWATVRADVVALAKPHVGARPVAPVSATTPEGTTNIVLVEGQARDDRGRLWRKARLATLPNGGTGWIQRRFLGGYGVVQTRLVVSLSDLEVTLFRNDTAVFRAPIGVGTADNPTPRGEFYIRNRLSRYRSPAYGPIAFGTSARSVTVTDWPGGGFVGIHGTDRPDLLPGRVSHGCIRMTNPDILRLDRLMPIGTPITIE